MAERQATTLEAELQRLATNLETPVIPGELEAWFTNLQDSAKQVQTVLERDIASVHRADYDRIVQQDPELTHRVEKLRAGDVDSITHLKALLGKLDQLAAKARRRGPDEAALDDEVAKLTQAGLDFVIHAQKQEVGRRTWFAEAFNRDRGVAD